jgi:preprotein translocase subunit YajC
MMPVLSLLLQAAPSRPSMLPFAIQFIAIIAIFWFLLIRPQRRRAQEHQNLLSQLKKGDEVMTEGGLIGEVVHIKDDRVTLKTAENTRVVVARSKIARVFTETTSTGGTS